MNELGVQHLLRADGKHIHANLYQNCTKQSSFPSINHINFPTVMKLDKNEITSLKNLLSEAENRSNETLEKLYKKMSGNTHVDLYVDGAADLHSKTSGIGGVFYSKGEEIDTFSEYFGDATNNEAEYSALIRGLQIALEMNVASINIFADSLLVVNQINGEFKVKHENMIPLHANASDLLSEFDSWEINHIPRDQNKVADKLSKAGMMKGRS
ncbi:MAG TPA: reverse transcriptase-like protein [Candidatus Marinimicrobia bacterium]|nr:reverse transcriptase-like protein [Candidatus Neomarinimicrobiota bacterium]